MIHDDYLFDILIDFRFVTADLFDSMREEAKQREMSVPDLLIVKGLITSRDVALAKSVHFGMEFVELKNFGEISSEVLSSVPLDYVRKHHTVPVAIEGGLLVVATANPSDLESLDALNHLVSLEVVVKIASEEDIRWAIVKYFNNGPESE